MNRILLLSVCLLFVAPTRVWGAAADDAWSTAREAALKLRKDEQKRKFRHNWQTVAQRLEAIANRYPKSDHAPEAWFLLGECNSELSRFSQNDDDVEAAERAYRKLIDGWPKHTLADDAALALAHLLAEREGDPLAARRVLEAAVPNARDKKKDLQVLLASLPEKAARKEAPRKDKDKDKDTPVEKPKSAERTARETALAAAISRAVKPLQNLQLRLPHDEVPVQARRAPPAARARDDEAAASDAVGDDSDAASPLTALQERLRDVRVGTPDPAAEVKVRSQFKQLAKSEGASEVSLAQQLGLKVRRVIVDAGHGGHDTGAIGPGGTREKDAALAIALKLAARLQAMGLEVVLTRDDDSFVKLEDRTKIANDQRGDLFISVHCNAAPSHALRGIETYTLNTSSNRYSIRLAARENATTERGVGDLQYILADLATRANTSESSHLAERVQRALVADLSADWKDVRDLGTKEALFFVLLGAKMPAILVETSFISNADEESRLADEKYQQGVADSIAASVDAYLTDRSKVAQVD